MKSVILLSLMATTGFAQTIGDAATEPVKAATSNNWKNWAFAGGAIIAAAIGITIVALNEGSSHQH